MLISFIHPISWKMFDSNSHTAFICSLHIFQGKIQHLLWITSKSSYIGNGIVKIIINILSCSILETQLIALVFGLASVCFTLKIAGKNDGRSMVYLVLAGTIASSLFNAVGSLLKYTADPQDKLPEITYWLMGSFTSASYQKILIGCPLIIAGIAVIYLLRWRLNILSLSDDEARASGISIIELPLSILTAIIGAPVFISLLNKTRSNLR